MRTIKYAEQVEHADAQSDNPAWSDSLWLDRRWSEHLQALFDEAMAPPGVNPKWMALVGLAVDAAPHNQHPQGMRRHMRRALALGASREEVAAVLRYVSLLGHDSIQLGASILREELVMQKPR